MRVLPNSREMVILSVDRYGLIVVEALTTSKEET